MGFSWHLDVVLNVLHSELPVPRDLVFFNIVTSLDKKKSSGVGNLEKIWENIQNDAGINMPAIVEA